MKKLVLTLTLAIAALLSFAQIPQTFSYQGVVRDAESKIVAEKPITVNVQILQGTDEGTEVYAETHEVTTNANGLMTFELGSKNAEDFAIIDWSNAPYFVKTIATFDGKQISGVTPLLAVPYALYAAKAGNADVDLSAYATKEEIPSTDGFATKDELNALNIPSVEGLASETFVNEKIAEIDLSNYYLKSDVDALLAELNAKVAKLDEQLNPPMIVGGVIRAKFSVSEDKKIYFSQGNLQYQASTGTWRFAEHQYDIIGSDNSNISSTYTGWIDLFGWGTSGYNGKNPYMTNTNYSDYGDGLNDIAGTNYDWGVNNAISNDGKQAGLWRTLTKDEWAYLINTRIDASSKMGVVKVNNVAGLVLLPDDWTLPAGVTFTSGASGDFSQNTYSADDWTKMEANGAVFLPAAGYRYGSDVDDVGSNGDYWSSSAYGNNFADCLDFSSSNVYADSGFDRYGGLSVRLVQDAE
ncbi:MAG: hypothetical protein IKO90_02145 [Bacteroidales bacterium]|nr:hypothetical protein [Bacteroidales bacterium]